MKTEIKGNNNKVKKIGIQNVYNNLEKKEEIKLTKEAEKILKLSIESKEQKGYIIQVMTFGGYTVQGGNVGITSEDDRDIAMWKGALEDLVKKNFIKATNYKEEVFKVTREGYLYYDNNINIKGNN